MSKRGFFVILSGPSGIGKGTVAARIREMFPEIVTSISATTRSIRPGEEEGVHYFFKTQEEFDRMIADGEILEYATIYGNRYGTPRAFAEKMLDEGKIILLDIETVGAENICRQYPDAVSIYLLPPTMEALYERLLNRKRESREEVDARFAQARDELLRAPFYRYRVVNDDLDVCVRQVASIVETALIQWKDDPSFIEKLRKEVVVL
ncbi:MAG: guanylate kinase [Clostridia bacterium]|nr:guanylate kinase [Clostridia bacterium]